MASSLLFSDSTRSVVLVDIPRSIEEAQRLLPVQSASPRLVSCPPQAEPWLTPEPKAGRSTLQSQHLASPASAIAELMILESVRTALDGVKQVYAGPWCLPRIIRVNKQPGEEDAAPVSPHGEGHDSPVGEATIKGQPELLSPIHVDGNALIPEDARYILGDIMSQRSYFVQQAPSFELIILDPPWPSRSVKRKRKRKGGENNSYTTAHNMDELRSLLSQVPVASHLKPDGLVGVWVTNKLTAVDLLTGSNTGSQAGVFAHWGLELVGEWTWLKITSAGEPVVDLESQWRKPWERLLIAQRPGAAPRRSLPASLRRRTILGVPDLHSRKPNLRGLFGDVWPRGYNGLEVFARNLTAGWWAWGDDVLRFQTKQHWVTDGIPRHEKTEAHDALEVNP